MFMEIAVDWLYKLGSPDVADLLRTPGLSLVSGDSVEGSITSLRDPTNPWIGAECKVTVNSATKTTYSVQWILTKHEAGAYFYINGASSPAASVIMDKDERLRIQMAQQLSLSPVIMPERWLLGPCLVESLKTGAYVNFRRDATY